MDDLVILVADKNMQFAIQGALKRPQALGIRSVTFQFRTHMGRDGGVRTNGPEILQTERHRFRRALVVLDYEGCGANGASAHDVEEDLDRRLASTWGADAKAIVVSPEIDTWIWGSDNLLEEVFRWPLECHIRDWLGQKGFAFDENGKPARPKEALEAMTPVHRLPRSSALYEKVTGRISLGRCVDPAFGRLRIHLQSWFPQEES